MELGGAQRRPRQAGVGHDPLRGELRPEIAEHRAVDAADDWDAVGADDRDVDEVAHPGLRRRAHQVPRLLLVALGAARAVHDDLGALHRGVDALARGQVAGHELDALVGLVAVPAEHPNVGAGVPQLRDDEPPERARAAGDENGASR